MAKRITSRIKPPTPQQLALGELIRQRGNDPDSLPGQLVVEMMDAALKLLDDQADEGELKLVSRSFKELRHGLKVFRPYRQVRKLSIFGSARTPENHPQYRAAVQFARAMAKEGWMVITGAGDGIMGAGHAGAGREASFGVGIRLPFETNTNKYIAGDSKNITFRYFFTRKLMFLSQAHAVALFPGGFGTHDEGFEVLTLVQTGKSQMVPIVMIDEPGGAYWYYWDQYVREHLLANNLISPEDLGLYFITDDIAKATQHVQHFYRNYHSQRFVRDDLVIRLQQAPSARQLELLNGEFKDLIVQGKIESTAPLKEETDALELPRIRFRFTRRSYGRLRTMINRLNDLAC